MGEWGQGGVAVIVSYIVLYHSRKLCNRYLILKQWGETVNLRIIYSWLSQSVVPSHQRIQPRALLSTILFTLEK